MQTPSDPPATFNAPAASPVGMAPATAAAGTAPPREIGGPTGPEPTRYGDWERRGRCIDF
jgi:hypothetical protein